MDLLNEWMDDPGGKHPPQPGPLGRRPQSEPQPGGLTTQLPPSTWLQSLPWERPRHGAGWPGWPGQKRARRRRKCVCPTPRSSRPRQESREVRGVAGRGKRCLPGVHMGSATVLAEGAEAAAAPRPSQMWSPCIPEEPPLDHVMDGKSGQAAGGRGGAAGPVPCPHPQPTTGPGSPRPHGRGVTLRPAGKGPQSLASGGGRLS